MTSPTPTPRPTAGWVLPALVATALVVGLLGGVLGGALVLGTSGESSGALPALGGGSLDEENASVAAVAAALLPSTVQVRVTESDGKATGSGFVIDGGGHVITNNHVVAGVGKDGTIEVVDVEGGRHSAVVVGRSPVYDVAVLAVRNAGRLRAAALGSSRGMHVGDTVVAIGSPLGLSSTVTSGIVSALDRPVTTGPAGQSSASSYINAVQTDAAINPGNSGGPLVNLRGEVVGVNSAIATTGGTAGESGNIGVGFAIPMEQVRYTAQQILDSGRAEYPVIGANIDTGETTDGAVVVQVPTGTPAASAGLRKGDRIIAVGDTLVTDGISLIVAIRTHRPGDTVTLTVVRGGQARPVEVRLAAKVG